MLRLDWKGDLEAYEGACNVSWHGYADMSLCIIPLQGHAEVDGIGSVNGGGILEVKYVVEVVKVGAGGGADAKVVNHESEGGVAGAVSKEAAGTCLVVSVGFEVSDELLIREDAGLG